MDAGRFQAVRDALDTLLSEGVQTLDGMSNDMREDGLPQNWVDDITNLTQQQRQTLANDIPNDAPAWALTLRAHLVGE
jgi:hypothetical protein